jgi:8-oxo-dGTP pyrophosphatase MutT (NUDIX family)
MVDSPAPQPATTIILLHPESYGFSVFMVQRHRRSGFLPNAWVFPGGRVDPTDHLEAHPRVSGGATAIEQMGLETGLGIAYLVAGVRETLEESGIWLGGGEIPDASRHRLAAREPDLTIGAALHDHDASIDLDCVVPWSWWVTPKQERRRYDTRFLVAVTKDKRGVHDDVETVNSKWVNPREAIETGDHDRFPMAPPTWWTLFELYKHDSVEALISAARQRPQRPIEPVIKIDEEGFSLMLPGHPDHPESTPVDGMPNLVTFSDGRWIAPGIEIPDLR